ncbi:MAG: hypothetical protein Q7S39_06550 [Ignavibacteria bacterium]|nr:hypothetical protein [Ignavibacteria bacterium]
MKERISALKVNLRLLLMRVEKLEVNMIDYNLINKIEKIRLKIDELSDCLSEVEAIVND